MEWSGEVVKKGKHIHRGERLEKIESSKYNWWYKWIKREGILEYLKKGWGKSRRSRLDRFR